MLHQAPWQENSQATAGMDVYLVKNIERMESCKPNPENPSET